MCDDDLVTILDQAADLLAAKTSKSYSRSLRSALLVGAAMVTKNRFGRGELLIPVDPFSPSAG